MRLLVVGANGLLGSNVVHAARERGWDVTGTYHSTQPSFDVPLTEFDLREYATFEEILTEHDPAVVVNCAAMTDVDDCESDPDRAQLLNAEAPEGMGRQCDEMGLSFVHVSTDYVFDGESHEPYSETAATNPLQVYGESKRRGEEAVRATVADALVPRLSFVWGIHRNTDELAGFPAWVRGRIEAGDEVPLFTDQRVTPTRAGQAATTILDLLERDATGLYHVACSSCVSPYEFGQLLGDRMDAESVELTPASMGEVERGATRPERTCLRVEKVESELGRPQPTLAEDVESLTGVQGQIW